MDRFERTLIIFLSVGIVAILLATTVGRGFSKSEHDIRMELIEEKEALYRLERSLDSEKYYKETRKFTDSLKQEIDKQLK